jgi:hypothetical protein
MATVLTNAGKAIVTNRLRSGGTEPLNAAWGTGAGTAAIADTTLFTEATPRAAGTSSQATVTVTNDTYQVVATITAAGTLAITNAGLFDVITASSGNLFVKGDFTTINLVSGDSIQFTFKTTFS